MIGRLFGSNSSATFNDTRELGTAASYNDEQDAEPIAWPTHEAALITLA